MTKLFRFLSALSAFSAVVALTCAARAAEPANSVIALKAARLFDGKSKALITNGVVIVHGTTITNAGSNLPIPGGAQVIDLGDAKLSPGLLRNAIANEIIVGPRMLVVIYGIGATGGHFDDSAVFS